MDFLPVRFGKSKFAYLRPASDKRLEQMTLYGSTWVAFLTAIIQISTASPRQERQPNSSDGLPFHSPDLTIDLAKTIRPGMPRPDIIREFERLWTPGAFGKPFVSAARIGHGSGMGLTEPPSIWKALRKSFSRHGPAPRAEDRDRGGVFQVEEVFVVQGERGGIPVGHCTP